MCYIWNISFIWHLGMLFFLLLIILFFNYTPLSIILSYHSYIFSIMKEKSLILHIPSLKLKSFTCSDYIYTNLSVKRWIDLHIDFHYKQVYYISCIEHLYSLPLNLFINIWQKFFLSLSLFRLRNVCLISISINRLFEPTYWMYEPLISI